MYAHAVHPFCVTIYQNDSRTSLGHVDCKGKETAVGYAAPQSVGHKNIHSDLGTNL